MLKRGNQVIINNRTVKEVGTITRKYRRKEIIYYDVTTEKGSIFEGLTANRSFPVFVEVELSEKLLTNKLTKKCN